mgnify:CR=1 FL=1
MKKVLALCLIWVLALSLSGCGIFDMLNDDKDVVNLGSGDTYVRWNLVWNNNEYRPVQSAYLSSTRTISSIMKTVSSKRKERTE